MKSQPLMVADVDGNLIQLPNLIETIGFHIWLDGGYEWEVLEFLKSTTGADATFLDVGANIGAVTLPMAKRLSRGHVVAIEASPQVAPLLRQNISTNRLSNVTVVECAASTGDYATVPFYEAPLSLYGQGTSSPQDGRARLEIPAKSIDHILEENRVTTVTAMKVDVEGYEAHVFLGAERLLRSSAPPKIVFEFYDEGENSAFPGKKGWAQEILLGFGYRLWKLSDYLQKRPPLTEPLRSGFESIVGIPGRFC